MTAVLPPPPLPRSAGAAASTWRVPSWTGSNTYRFSRHAVVTSDSVGESALVFDTSGAEFLGRGASAGEIRLTLTAPIGGRPAPEQVSAAFVNGRVAAQKENAQSKPCNPTRSQLQSDLFDLAVTLPPTLSRQASWSDSLQGNVCLAEIEGTSDAVRHFQVVGDTTVNGEGAIMISRRDSAAIAAEGVVDQHRTAASGTAAANAILYVSVASGKILRITKEQVLLLSIAAEGHTRAFTQKLTSTIDLIR